VVKQPLSATAISASVAAPSLEAGLLHQAGLTLPQRRFCVLCHVERYRSRAADALLARINVPDTKSEKTSHTRDRSP
jgi:hypothetical protein